MTHHVHHHCLVGGKPIRHSWKDFNEEHLTCNVAWCNLLEKSRKFKNASKKIEAFVIPPQLKRMYLETEEKEVNPLYVSLDVKYIIYLEFVRMESWMTSV